MESQIVELAHQVQDILARKGYCRVVHANQRVAYRVPPAFYRVVRSECGQYVALHVDTDHLPRSVSIDQLSQPDTVNALSNQLRNPVRVLNGRGVIFVLQITPEPSIKVPA